METEGGVRLTVAGMEYSLSPLQSVLPRWPSPAGLGA